MRWALLCGSLSILWHCPSLRLKGKLTISSPVATAEFSKFVGILNAALSQHHLLGFEIAQFEFHWLFIAMLSKAHLTSHSRMSCSRSVITLSWLSRSLRPFLYSDVYSCLLFLISSASVRSLPFLSFLVLILAWNVPLISPVFLKRSLVFPILLISFISLHCSLKKAFLSLLAILWNSAFSWAYLSLSLSFHFFSFLSYF